MKRPPSEVTIGSAVCDLLMLASLLALAAVLVGIYLVAGAIRAITRAGGSAC